MVQPEVGQKVKVLELYAPFYVEGKYAGMEPVFRVGVFLNPYTDYDGNVSWVFKDEENRTFFSTCAGNQWEAV